MTGRVQVIKKGRLKASYREETPRIQGTIT